MIDKNIKALLLNLADKYEDMEYFKGDPIIFPKQYTITQDIEISGLLSSVLSFAFSILRAVILNGYKDIIEEEDLDLLYKIWKNDKIKDIIRESKVIYEHDKDIIDRIGHFTLIELFTQDDEHDIFLQKWECDVEYILIWHLSHYYGNKLK